MPIPPASPSRRLVLLRHAQAEQLGSSDHERALTARGSRNAVAAGRWLAEQGVSPEVALVSSARRTRSTWAGVADGAGWSLDPVVEDGLYESGPASVLDLVWATDDAVRTLLVVGHNPTMAMLASTLDDGEGDPDAGNALALGYPPASVAVLNVPGGWTSVQQAALRLTAFHTARG
ncbi:SixA phosphatase family protein [Nocardioides bruguierae]|uniref:Histidine phosphatase family protein n=1 Tax=Nocardioides bruguierae TaxID=2945102 RepID=A0A9X2D492_9ACTN|nr:histidine phosphatase family protein [Nocardioides bruguierae]MCM0618933.1 histidine phosphatase family protein [Nocardioides bruguierae]